VPTGTGVFCRLDSSSNHYDNFWSSLHKKVVKCTKVFCVDDPQTPAIIVSLPECRNATGNSHPVTARARAVARSANRHNDTF
jgi:hypothetical protein